MAVKRHLRGSSWKAPSLSAQGDRQMKLRPLRKKQRGAPGLARAQQLTAAPSCCAACKALQALSASAGIPGRPLR